MNKTTSVSIISLMVFMLLSSLARAEPAGYELTILDHHFEPDTLTVPAGVKVRLRIHNMDSSPEEFESHALHREKLVAGGASITVFIGPLQPGQYPFIGEFHPDSAKGVIIVK